MNTPGWFTVDMPNGAPLTMEQEYALDNAAGSTAPVRKMQRTPIRVTRNALQEFCADEMAQFKHARIRAIRNRNKNKRG